MFKIRQRHTETVLRRLDTLRGADLSNADLCRATLYGANLSGANLYEVDLDGADLYEADLPSIPDGELIVYKKSGWNNPYTAH